MHAHGAAGAALELPVYRASMPHEILACGGISQKKLDRQQRTLELVTRAAGGHQVAGQAAAPAAEWYHVVQCGVLESQDSSAVDTSTSAIPKGLTFDLALVLLVEHTASVSG